MKITVKDFNLNLEGMSEEAKAFATKQHEAIAEVVNKAMEGSISKEEVVSKFNEINATLKGFDTLQKDN